MELAQSRYPDNGTILTTFITAALSPNTAHQRPVTAEVEELMLETLARSSEAKQAVLANEELKSQVRPGLCVVCGGAAWIGSCTAA